MKTNDIIIGNTYKNLKILHREKNRNKNAYFTCECTICGSIFSIRADHIGHVESCRKCSRELRCVDLTNLKFGKLTPIERVGRKNGRTLWRCVCDCGNHTIVGYSNLLYGITKSCGCYNKERIRQRNNARRQSTQSEAFLELPNISKHPLHRVWSSMIARCKYDNRKCAKYYCHRGIKVCDRWTGVGGFENFIKDMGDRPSPRHTLDRINVNGNYEPSNCRWADIDTQSINKQNTRYVYVNGERIPLKTLCADLGLRYHSVIKQLNQGFDLDYIVKHPHCDFRSKKYSDAPKNFNIYITINH